MPAARSPESVAQVTGRGPGWADLEIPERVARVVVAAQLAIGRHHAGPLLPVIALGPGVGHQAQRLDRPRGRVGSGGTTQLGRPLVGRRGEPLFFLWVEEFALRYWRNAATR